MLVGADTVMKALKAFDASLQRMQVCFTTSCVLGRGVLT